MHLFQLSSPGAACPVAAREGTRAPARNRVPEAVCGAVVPWFPRSLHRQNRRSPAGNRRQSRGGNSPFPLPGSLRFSLPVPCGVWVADGPLPVAPPLPPAATARVAADQAGSGPVAGSGLLARVPGSARNGLLLGVSAATAPALEGWGGGGGGRGEAGSSPLPPPLPASPGLTCVNVEKGRRGGSPRTPRKPPKSGLSRHCRACLPAPARVREAVREALGSEGVLPQASLARLPRGDLRKQGLREVGRDLPQRPETPENRVFRGCALPPSLTSGRQLRQQVTPADRSDLSLPGPLPTNQHATRTNRQEVSQVSAVTQTPRHPANTGFRQARPPPSLPPPQARASV